MEQTMSNESPRERLANLMQANAITIEAVFVPWSKSRNFKPGIVTATDRSLNWRITLKHDGRAVYMADYSAGVAHCPSYKGLPRFDSVDGAEALRIETEKGKRATDARGNLLHYVFGKPIVPDPCNVLSALLIDGEAIDYPTYEQYARELDMDADSRKGEAMYRECVQCGLALRAAFGEKLLAELRDVAREL